MTDEERASIFPGERTGRYESGKERDGQPQYKYVYYYWRDGELRAGDCHQINGTLMFRSDGAASFDADVWTDHTNSGDIWHSSFIVDRDDLTRLLDIGQIDSPKTYGAHVHMHGDFHYDPSKFSQLPNDPKRVSQMSSC